MLRRLGPRSSSPDALAWSQLTTSPIRVGQADISNGAIVVANEDAVAVFRAGGQWQRFDLGPATVSAAGESVVAVSGGSWWRLDSDTATEISPPTHPDRCGSFAELPSLEPTASNELHAALSTCRADFYQWSVDGGQWNPPARQAAGGRVGSPSAGMVAETYDGSDLAVTVNGRDARIDLVLAIGDAQLLVLLSDPGAHVRGFCCG